jgi:heme-degrading monooxygenase HmoA
MTVTVINKFVIPDEVLAEFLTEFTEHRSVLAQQPGFISGKLFKQISGPGRFNIVNFAVWQDEQSLHAARAALGVHYRAHGTDPSSRYRAFGIETDIASYTEIETY